MEDFKQRPDMDSGRSGGRSYGADRGGDDKNGMGGGFRRRFVFKKKFCRFCKEKIEHIDYKEVDMLVRYTKSKGKILPRRFTGNCPRHQRMLAHAIKRSRAVALLPYVGV